MKRDHWREDALCIGQPLEVFFASQTLAEDRWDAAKEHESERRETLKNASANWEKIEEMFK